MRRHNRREVVQGATAVAAMTAASPLLFGEVAPKIVAPGSQLLIRVVNGENHERYMAGDVVNVLAGDPVRGRMEDLDVWLEEGKSGKYIDGKRRGDQTVANWPRGYQLVYLPTVSHTIASRYQVEGEGVRRVWRADIDALLRMATSPKSQHKIVIDHDPKLIYAAFSMKSGVSHKYYMPTIRLPVGVLV